MKISLREITCAQLSQLQLSMGPPSSWGSQTYILMLQMLQELQFSVCPLRQDGCAEGLHDLLDGDALVGELVFRGAAHENAHLSATLHRQDPEPHVPRGEMEVPYQTRPNAPIPTGWRSEYLRAVKLAFWSHQKAFPSVADWLWRVGGRFAAHLDVISKVVPKIWARTNSAMVGTEDSRSTLR